MGYVSYVNCILCFFNPCPLWTILSIGVNVLICYLSVFMSVFSTIQPSFSLLHNVIFIYVKVYLMDSLTLCKVTSLSNLTARACALMAADAWADDPDGPARASHARLGVLGGGHNLPRRPHLLPDPAAAGRPARCQPAQGRLTGHTDTSWSWILCQNKLFVAPFLVWRKFWTDYLRL